MARTAIEWHEVNQHRRDAGFFTWLACPPLGMPPVNAGSLLGCMGALDAISIL